jgi:hypothetical protein
MAMRPLLLLPEIVLFLGGLAVLVSGSFLPRTRQWVTRVIAAVALVAAGILAAVDLPGPAQPAMEGTFTVDTGAVVWTSSTEPTERLGEILRGAGHVDDQALATSMADAASGPLGARLVEHGAVAPEALRGALLSGAFYASTGPAAEFDVADGEIRARAARDTSLHFFDRDDRLLLARPGPEARYRPLGQEGFVRVECRAPGGRTAWSQPFWVERGRAFRSG